MRRCPVASILRTQLRTGAGIFNTFLPPRYRRVERHAEKFGRFLRAMGLLPVSALLPEVAESEHFLSWQNRQPKGRRYESGRLYMVAVVLVMGTLLRQPRRAQRALRVPFAEREAPMLRIYARVWAAVLALIAIAAALRMSRVGLGVSVLYLSSTAVFAYAGFSGRTSTIIRSVVAAMGLFFLLSGLLVAFTMSVLGSPSKGGAGNRG
jgi:hypothetical protein